MYITLRFTSVKGLSTDIAYGSYQFNPDRANFAFISISTPQPCPPLPYSFPWERHFSVVPSNCVTWINYLPSESPCFLICEMKESNTISEDVCIKWDKIYQCLKKNH